MSSTGASERSKLRRHFARAFKYAEGPRVRDEMVCKEAAGLVVQTTEGEGRGWRGDEELTQTSAETRRDCGMRNVAPSGVGRRG